MSCMKQQNMDPLYAENLGFLDRGPYSQSRKGAPWALCPDNWCRAFWSGVLAFVLASIYQTLASAPVECFKSGKTTR